MTGCHVLIADIFCDWDIIITVFFWIFIFEKPIDVDVHLNGRQQQQYPYAQANITEPTGGFVFSRGEKGGDMIE